MRDNHEVWKGWTPCINLVAAACIVGAGAAFGHEGAAQFAAAHDQRNIDQCQPLIAKLPTKGLTMDCRNVKAAMEASQQDLINSMHNLRDAYLTLGRREAEATHIRRGTIWGVIGGFAVDVVGGGAIFLYNRKDRRWCAEYEEQVYPSTLYNKQRKMTA